MATTLEYAYLAGIIDGEGTITLSRDLKSSKYRSVVVSVANTDMTMINYLRDTFGGRTTKRTSRAAHHNDAFDWRVDKRQAVALLEMVYPFLQNEIKKDRAKHIIDHYVRLTPRNGKYSPQMMVDKRAFEDAFFSL